MFQQPQRADRRRYGHIRLLCQLTSAPPGYQHTFIAELPLGCRLLPIRITLIKVDSGPNNNVLNVSPRKVGSAMSAESHGILVTLT